MAAEGDQLTLPPISARCSVWPIDQCLGGISGRVQYYPVLDMGNGQQLGWRRELAAGAAGTGAARESYPALSGAAAAGGSGLRPATRPPLRGALQLRRRTRTHGARRLPQIQTAPAAESPQTPP